MRKVIISPYSRGLRNSPDKVNAKNYPWFSEVVNLLRSNGVETIQVGVIGEKPIGADKFFQNYSFSSLAELVKECDTWISVDNFFQHMCYVLGKPGVVIFGQSDPIIFGHNENTNLLKDRKYLRPNQFDMWESALFTTECFVPPSVVVDAVLKRFE
jgi:hypothetical protein